MDGNDISGEYPQCVEPSKKRIPRATHERRQMIYLAIAICIGLLAAVWLVGKRLAKQAEQELDAYEQPLVDREFLKAIEQTEFHKRAERACAELRDFYGRRPRPWRRRADS